MDSTDNPLRDYAQSRGSFVRAVKKAEAYLDVDFSYEPLPGMEIVVIPNDEAWMLWDKSQVLMDYLVVREQRRAVKAAQADAGAAFAAAVRNQP